ncbi:hypothetical protein NDU88_000752 [Pleurodeles waltl]|uniref:Uncharacterized protein n=1 Tax=Pleurodeles waltl TaxID=8319 RepID=A0AAV7SAE6_PLEWA|nr:hypothetical protein NDU88_000752 [Pleurodeles waltl]
MRSRVVARQGLGNGLRNRGAPRRRGVSQAQRGRPDPEQEHRIETRWLAPRETLPRGKSTVRRPIVGVVESTNIDNMERYVEHLLTDVLGHENFSATFVVKQAHLTLGLRLVLGAPPRLIVGRLLNYRDRDAALRKARELGTEISRNRIPVRGGDGLLDPYHYEVAYGRPQGEIVSPATPRRN